MGGARVEHLQIYTDDRDYFSEIARVRRGLGHRHRARQDKKDSDFPHAYLSQDDYGDLLPFGGNRSVGSGGRPWIQALGIEPIQLVQYDRPALPLRA